MKKLLLTLSLTLIATTSSAWDYKQHIDTDTYNQNSPVIKYNPHTKGYETTYPQSQLKYNPYDKSWSYQNPNAQPKYNPYNKKWEYPR